MSFPRDWRILGLWLEDGSYLKASDYPGKFSDDMIEDADAIVVGYGRGRDTDIRTIHGARSRDQVGDLIRKVVVPTSPVGRKRRR